MTEEELKDYPLEQLKKTRREKEHREDLISKLSESDKFDEEDLRQASTRDLEKLVDTVEEQDDDDREEMEEEAQEDLKMLMGAVNGDQAGSQDEGTHVKKRVGEFASHLHDTFERGNDEEEETDRIQQKDLMKVLDKYEKIGGEEAAIKSAHVVKAYLEQELGLEKELTYRQLADEIPKDNENLEKAANFFRRMHREQYKNGLDIKDGSKYVEICRKAVKSV